MVLLTVMVPYTFVILNYAARWFSALNLEILWFFLLHGNYKKAGL